MKEIPLTQGKVALVDDEDFEWLSQWKWFAHREARNWYAMRHDGEKKLLYMHREIMDAPQGMQVDHINQDGLRNLRCNLRLATPSENRRNKKRPINNTTGYKGVTFDKRKRKFMAQIFIGETNKFLGYFDSPDKAGRAYDRAAMEMYGEFAFPNFNDYTPDQTTKELLEALK